jgi:ATP-binding cassette subfamily F protein 1
MLTFLPARLPSPILLPSFLPQFEEMYEQRRREVNKEFEKYQKQIKIAKKSGSKAAADKVRRCAVQGGGVMGPRGGGTAGVGAGCGAPVL